MRAVGFPIIQLVADWRSGMRLADLKDAYPHVDDESLYAGVAYYLANKQVLDLELDERDRKDRAYADWQKRWNQLHPD